MESKNMVGLIIACAIGIILIGTLLSPVVDGYKAETLTIKNTGMPFTEAGGDHTIVVTTENITYDGEVVDMSLFPGNFQTYTLVYGEESFVRWGITNVLTVSSSDSLRTFNVSNANTVTITLSGTTVTVTTTASTQSFTANDVLYHISPSGGDYVLALNPYVNDEDTVYAAGDTYFTGSNRPGPIRLWIVWTGTLEDITISANGFSGSSWDSSSVALDKVNLTNVKSNLYRYDSVLFNYTATATVDEVSTDYTLPATYTYFLAPETVEYDNPDYIGDYGGLLTAIVVLSLVGVLIMAVGMITFGRRD